MLEQWLFDGVEDGSMNEGLSAQVPPKVTVREVEDVEMGMGEGIVNDVRILLSTTLGLILVSSWDHALARSPDQFQAQLLGRTRARPS